MSNSQETSPRQITRQRVAAGRKDASRWALYEQGTPLGELVHWKREAMWEWQPLAGESIEGASEAEVLLRAGLV